MTCPRERHAPLADETIARLAELPQIAGLKDATGDPSRVARLRMLLGTDFRLVSGDDGTALTFIAQGGDGCISVASNVAPGLCRDMFLSLRQGQITRAQRLSHPIAQLTAALFRETNPAPLKFALNLFDLMAPRVRLPLVEIGEKTKSELIEIVARLCNDWSASTIGRIDKPLGAWRRAS
jgi:4-hydroxy-tetrahydrodipicolinate synthase